ncbi:MAG: LamG domain-containing protein [Candidatus Marinimicrobia bacterium]|nr:LamG domain-containing protein [Candidatus Neomarinimicrobiota bacterium]
MKTFSALMMVIILLIVSGCNKTTESDTPSPNLTDDLVAYWSFTGNTDDDSGNGHVGILKGATLIDDRFGNANSAYYFDGIDDYITIKETDGFDDFDDPETEFTLSAWCNPDPGASGFIFSNCTEDGWHDLRMSNQIPRFGIRDTDWTGTVFNSDEPVSANEWHHFVGIFNDPNMTIYVDGQNKGTTPFIGNILSSGGWENGGIRIGVTYLLDPWHFEGGIDDVRIYNRVLFETEVLELYNEGI